MSNNNTAVAIVSDKQNGTPFHTIGFQLNDSTMEVMRSRLESANMAQAGSFTDVTPIYWEAEAGEQKMMAFLGWKPVAEKDDKGNVTGERFMPVFHDGSRQVVMGQISAVEAMMNRPSGPDMIYRITCTEAARGKAKKFKVEEFKG
jgi:hypothetical protein